MFGTTVRLHYVAGHPEFSKPCDITVIRSNDTTVTFQAHGFLSKSVAVPIDSIRSARIMKLGDLDPSRTAGLITAASFLAGPFAGIAAAQGAQNRSAIVVSVLQGRVEMDMVFEPLRKIDKDYRELTRVLA